MRECKIATYIAVKQPTSCYCGRKHYNRHVAVKLFLALLLTTHIGHVALAQGKDDQQAKLEVKQMEKEWREAWIRGDSVALDRIHADDYLAINYLGQMNTKAQVMSDVRAGAFKYDSMEHKDIVMRVYGNVVMVDGRLFYRITHVRRLCNCRYKCDIFNLTDGKETAIAEGNWRRWSGRI